VAWVAEQIADEVDRQQHDPARVRSELLRLELDHDAGLVGDEEYEARSEELIERLAARPAASGVTATDEDTEVSDG
jgi:hypothetical protein